jgi:hypothetical protein
MGRLLMVLALVAGLPARAEEFRPVKELEAFLSLTSGRTLRMPLYGLSLTLSPDGVISGKALGWGITGRWRWEDGFFCRDMDWSGMAIPFNCQLVEARGETELRFTVDRGAGESASFKLR